MKIPMTCISIFIGLAVMSGGSTGDLQKVQTALQSTSPNDQIQGLKLLLNVANETTRARYREIGKEAAVAEASAVVSPYKARVLELAASDNPGVANLSLMLLAWMKESPDIVNAIVLQCRHTNNEVKGFAFESLHRIDYRKYPQAQQVVRDALRDENERTFRDGARVVEAWKWGDALPELQQSLYSDNAERIRASARAMLAVGAGKSEIESVLLTRAARTTNDLFRAEIERVIRELPNAQGNAN